MTFSRREFLGAVGLGTAWSVTAKAEPERSANNIVRIGVIGTGVRGKYLIGNLPPLVTVGAICDCASVRIASVVSHSDGILLRAALARFTFSRMSSAFFVQTKVFGFAL